MEREREGSEGGWERDGGLGEREGEETDRGVMEGEE